MAQQEAMRDQLVSYFSAEKHESALFILIGLAALGASIWLYRSSSPYRAMLYPLAAIALIQIVVGGTVFARTEAQVKSLTAQLQSDPAAYKSAELSRMDVVVKNFKLYKAIEIVLLAAGIAMSFVFRQNPALYAVAIGLILQSSIMLVLDLFAEQRADEYVARIRELLGD